MLDLPLRSEDSLAEQPTIGPDRLRPERPAEAGPSVRGAQRRRRLDRRRLLLLAAIAVALLAAAYFLLWPKPPRAAFEPDPLEVGRVRVGAVGKDQAVAVTNDGERPMTIAEVTLAGSEAAEYGLLEDGCSGRLLQAQESCRLQLQFSPLAMGPRRAVIELHANVRQSPARLTVSGEGIAPLLVVSPASVRFGGQDVGTTSASADVSVSNQGTAPLEVNKVLLAGAAEGDFRITSNECSRSTLQPVESCGLRVVFEPRAAGPRSAAVSFRSDALEPVPVVDLEGEGIWSGAAFAVEPTAVDFGRHLVGTSRLRRTIQVVNRQSTALERLQVGLADTGSGFSLGPEDCSDGALRPGESCRIEVRFAAAREGATSTLLRIAHRDVGSLGIELSGQGVAPRWVLAPTALEFGPTRVEASSEEQAVELRNEGTAAAKVSKVEMIGADAGAFQSGADGCAGREIAPDRGCSLRVRFRPRREGVHRATILLHAAAGESPQRAELRATATAPRLSLDREMVDFGRVHRTTLQPIELGVSNRGTAPLRLALFSLAENPAGDFQILGGSCLGRETLPAGERCTLQIGYGPTAEGRSTAKLELEHDGLSGPRVLPLAGVGLPPPLPRMVLTTPRLDFGPQPIGERSSILTVSLQAGGTGPLELRGFSVDGPQPADFVIVPATCQAAPTLLPGSGCAVGVRFVPSAAGERLGRLVITHNAEPGTTAVELRGEGLGGPPRQ